MKIFLIGFMGSGKSYLGRQLGQKLGIPFFDLDEQVTTHAGKSIPEIFDTEGEEHFRLLEKEVLFMITESHDSFILATGGGTPCFFNNIDYMNRAGTTVWIHTAVSVLFDRLVKERPGRPLIRNLSDDQLMAFIFRKYSDRKIYYEQATVTIDEEPVDIDKLVETIFHA